jgi:hypothetical protein
MAGETDKAKMPPMKKAQPGDEYAKLRCLGGAGQSS